MNDVLKKSVFWISYKQVKSEWDLLSLGSDLQEKK